VWFDFLDLRHQGTSMTHCDAFGALKTMALALPIVERLKRLEEKGVQRNEHLGWSSRLPLGFLSKFPPCVLLSVSGVVPLITLDRRSILANNDSAVPPLLRAHNSH
jgi:hypothetical protein